jgi:hypothetical protein
MNELTQEQAAELRKHRGDVIRAVSLVHTLAIEFAGLCHKDQSIKNCDTCELYDAFAAADNALHDMDGYLDSMLERGPSPNGEST